MSADTRSTHTDALETLGSVHTTVQHRDAIHLGVEPAIAGEYLSPGAHVCLINGKAYGALNHGKRPIGIVDPFLMDTLHQGQRFWLVVYPRQITSLRHVWEHPDFPGSDQPSIPSADVATAPSEAELHRVALMLGDPRAEALEWIRTYAAEISEPANNEIVTADDLITHAMTHVDTNDHFGGDYLVVGGLLEGVSVHPMFWEKLAVYKNITIDHQKRNNFFSCSC